MILIIKQIYTNIIGPTIYLMEVYIIRNISYRVDRGEIKPNT
jgi:hypothetical protein